MFKTLFRSPSACSRHLNGPLAIERSEFLAHLASQGMARATLLSYAPLLLLVATCIRKGRGTISRSEIVKCAQQWARRQRRLGRAKTMRWPVRHFVQKGCAWCSYMGRLKDEPEPVAAYEPQIEKWASFLRTDEGLAERTIYGYRWWITKFCRWLQEKGLRLQILSPGRVDSFIKELASAEMTRVTLSDAACALRRFLHFAHEKGWCRRDLAPFILSPRLFRHENLPSGPKWPDVQRMIAATGGSSKPELRNRAMLLLLAVYGFRCGEVTSLRLDDVDWSGGILRVRRCKTARVQEYPLAPATGQAIKRYLNEARPKSTQPELFLTLRPPFRRLSAGAVYEVTSSLFGRLGISSSKRGPHALRHACASFLLNTGSSLKAIGDHLGHQTPSATQVYAKIDLAGLRAVASFDLGGIL